MKSIIKCIFLTVLFVTISSYSKAGIIYTGSYDLCGEPSPDLYTIDNTFSNGGGLYTVENAPKPWGTYWGFIDNFFYVGRGQYGDMSLWFNSNIGMDDHATIYEKNYSNEWVVTAFIGYNATGPWSVDNFTYNLQFPRSDKQAFIVVRIVKTPASDSISEYLFCGLDCFRGVYWGF